MKMNIQKIKTVLKKNINVVLALMIAATAFCSHGIKVDAAYNTGTFYYDISDVWNPSAEDGTLAKVNSEMYPYVYVFLHDTSYTSQWFNDVFMTKEPLVFIYRNGKDISSGYQLCSPTAGTNFAKRYRCMSGWTSFSSTNYISASSKYYPIADIPGTSKLMTNTHIYYYLSGERVYVRNISEDANKRGTNRKLPTDDGVIDSGSGNPSGGASTGSNVTNNNYNVTMDDMDKGFLQSIRDNLLSVLQNISNLASTLSNDVVNNLRETHNSLNSLSSTVRNSILDVLNDNASGISELTTTLRTSFWATLNDIADSSTGISNLLRKDFLSSIEDNTKAATDVSAILRKDILDSVVDNTSNMSQLTSIIRGDFWNSVLDNTKGLSDLTAFMRQDFWLTVKDTYSGISDIAKLLREEFWESSVDNVKAITDLTTFLRGEFWTSFKDNISAMANIADMLRNHFWDSITDIVDRIISIDDFIRDGIFGRFQDMLEYLFSPSDDTVSKGVEDIASKFTLIESTHTTINTVKDGMKSFGQTPPVIDIPVSETFLAKYGVPDCQITFDWFEPYRKMCLALESAFMWVMFAFNQYFGLKDMFNATGSGVAAASRLV